MLLAIQQQLTMLQSTIDTLREQSRQKDVIFFTKQKNIIQRNLSHWVHISFLLR